MNQASVRAETFYVVAGKRDTVGYGSRFKIGYDAREMVPQNAMKTRKMKMITEDSEGRNGRW